MKKSKHPQVRLDSDVMDDLEKICNDPQNKLSKTSFASEAIQEKIRKEQEKKNLTEMSELIDHYKERSSDYYEKGIKNKDEFFDMVVLNKDVLKIGKAQEKLENELKEWQDTALIIIDESDKFTKHVQEMEEKIKKLGLPLDQA